MMSKKTHISPEDQTLFRNEMRGVTPLKNPKPKISTETIRDVGSCDNHLRQIVRNRQRRSTEKQDSSSAETLILQDLSNYYATPVQAESLLIYHQAGVGRMQTHALRTGQITYQAKLDLHGLNTDDAKIRLTRFLSNQIQAQHRWVLIIHGKGGRFGEAPVLKNLVNHWLQQIPTVLAFHSAQPKHGGTGALYVLLKSSAKT